NLGMASLKLGRRHKKENSKEEAKCIKIYLYVPDSGRGNKRVSAEKSVIGVIGAITRDL
ncbi:15558_t:CDS:1, partial [Entrophospora sp. SA101]